MKILRVKGAGLASLAAEFDVDLTDAELRSAGLFMISGLTGAGKSTILDAILLALFDALPRSEGGGADLNTGQRGDRFEKANASSAILSRGAGWGYAEVDFIGADEATYQARWEVHRARKKASGTLQPAQVTLLRFGEGGATQFIGGTKTETLAAIERALGLSRDQFTRTVLLAQNRFDAFLTADEKARAELLEAITGEEVYAQISQRVYQMAAAKRAALKEQETLATLVAVMTDEERQRTETAHRDLAGSLATLEVRQAALEAAGAWWRRDQDLGEAYAAAQARLAESNAQLAALDGARADLERTAAALALAPLVAEEAAAVAQSNAAQAALEAARAASVRAAAAEAAGQTRLTACQTASAAAEAASSAFEPQWAAASDLDRRIAETAAAAHAAGEAARQAHQAHAHALARCASVQRDIARLQTARDAADADAAAAAPAATALDRAGEVDSRLAAHARLTSEVAALDCDLARETQSLHTAEAACERATLNLESIAAEVAGIERALASVTAAMEAADGAGLRKRQRELVALGATLAGLDWISADAARAQAAIAAADIKTAVLRHQANEARAAIAACARELPVIEARIEEARTGEQAFALALGDDAVRLRGALSDGEPCPVCGSPEHPLHDTGLAAALAGRRARIADLERDRAQRADRAHRAQVIAEQADATLADLQAQHALDLAAIGNLCRRWQAAVATAGLAVPGSPAEPAAAAAVAILMEETSVAITAVDAGLGRLDDLARDQAALAVRANTARARRLVGEETLRQAGDARSAARQALAGLSARRSERQRQRDSEEAALSPVLSAMAIAPATLRSEPDDVSRRVRTAVAALADARRRQSAAALALSDLAPQLAAAQADLAHRAAAEAAARTVADGARAGLSALQAERAGLFDGEATDIHRARHGAELENARRAREAAKDQLQADRLALASATAAVAAAQTVEASAGTRAGLVAAELARALVARGLDRGTAEGLIARGPSWIETARAAIRAAEDAATGASHALAAAGDRLAAHRAAAARPAEPAHAVAAALAALVTERDGAHTRLGSLARELAADDDARRRRADIEAGIAALRADLDVWDAVDDAVGSSDGSKFRRFALGHTFAALIEHANVQLQLLSPRYRLARAPGDLSLQVVDQDMGCDVRGVRSLSGGERFLVSLALALALSTLGAGKALIETLFIDEGFGALDPESLDLALDGLDALRSQGRMIGVISHVEAMADRFPVQIVVEKQGGGRSTVRMARAQAQAA